MTSHGPRLRIAYIVGAFPAVSETFIVNQVVGMAERGHGVDIFTTVEQVTSPAYPEVQCLGLMQRIVPLAPAASRIRGVLKIAVLLLTVGWRAPKVVARVCAEMGRSGLTGSARLLYAALVLIQRGTPRYDVIHGQFGQFGLLALQLKRVGAIDGAIVTSFRGYDVEKHLRAYPGAYDDLFRAGALCLPVSRTLSEGLLQAGCDPSKVKVHHSGVSCRRLAYRDAPPVDGPVRVITVARLVEKKGVAYAIHAVARALAAGVNVSYTVVGDGPLRRSLEALAETLQVDEYIRWAGAQPHAATLEMIRAAQLLLAPSVTAADGDAEGIPNVLKEAMANGLPVIATRHGGTSELVDDGVSGLLVAERDTEALAEKLAYLASHPECWAAMGRAGRKKVELEFDIERLNAELEEMYTALAAAPQSSDRGHNISGAFRAGTAA
jgi:colanic acid/amylovoran biosynthesis glycosyltransferase